MSKIIIKIDDGDEEDDQELKTYDNFKSTPKDKNDIRPTICFTGISTIRRFELKEIAEERELRVITSPTKSLAILVVGPSAGWSKIQKAVANGTVILNEAEFLRLLENTAGLHDFESTLETYKGTSTSNEEARNKAIAAAQTFRLKNGQSYKALMQKEVEGGYILNTLEAGWITIARSAVEQIVPPEGFNL